MKPVYVVDCARTAIGSFLGSLKTTPAHLLGKSVITALVERNNIAPEYLSEIILGQILTAGQGQNPARQAAIAAKIPQEVPAYLVNMVCGSGLKTISMAAQSIALGDSNLVIAGGQENMSLANHCAHLRSGVKMGNMNFTDSMLEDGLTDAFSKVSMGITAENIADKYDISRDEQDQFAYLSQQKASLAQKEGRFKQEIIPVHIKNKKEEIIFDMDEYIKHDTTLQLLQGLKPAFKPEGSVTAGNSSGINDGAAALLIADETILTRFKLTPMARIVSYAMSGVDPQIMGIGPVSAVQKALAKAGWNIEDLDLIEANEAFAAQAIAVNRLLGWDCSKVNVNGGAIALGHPIGASGARIATTLLHEMTRRRVKKGLATLCIGGGMGIAICFEMS